MTNNKSVSKTVHTPIFYTTPQPSASTSSTHSADTPTTYLDNLSRKHVALAQIVEEIPGEDEDPESKERVEILRKQVIGAFELAKGEPADGKWTAVAQLLRLKATRGRSRWLGSSREGRTIVSSTGWINARTESEWSEWERKWIEEDKVKRKVESWKQKLDTHLPPPTVISISDESEGPGYQLSIAKGKARATVEPVATPKKAPLKSAGTLLNALGRDPRDPSALGFMVMKRSSLALNGKPKHAVKSPTNNKVAGPSKSKPTPGLEVADSNARTKDTLEMDSSSPKDIAEKQNIADISETSFLPPSFPSQLPTSTPNDKTDRRQKPPPIPLFPASSPLSSPPNVRTSPRSKTYLYATPSLPELPETPKRKAESTTGITQLKRRRSVSPDQAAKKARTTAPSSSGGMGPPSSPLPLLTDDPTSSPMIVTPKRPGKLPTLKELLASSKNAKQSPRKKRIIASPLVTLNKGLEKETIIDCREPSKEEKANDEPDSRLPFLDPLPLDDPLSGLTAGLGYDAASPTKSLSSLAESDSDSDDGGINTNLLHDIDDDFNPPFASTQAQGKDTGSGLGVPKGSSGFGWMGYSSQFDVNGKVDQVSKFMEKDVDYDWLGGPAPEIEESQW
ncbi:hypothetical protein BDZ94DRAFT_1265033 [Collybia nuda]|uniref:Uncharacterized protein n=1 Tax=Collybia nuda TaxID=64659 RepID=A0A9P6CCQ0_9AGAR|nr:hypothetical protein BDZ94DRAFT_1265033 [Collybia nuda]